MVKRANTYEVGVPEEKMSGNFPKLKKVISISSTYVRENLQTLTRKCTKKNHTHVSYSNYKNLKTKINF